MIFASAQRRTRNSVHRHGMTAHVPAFAHGTSIKGRSELAFAKGLFPIPRGKSKRRLQVITTSESAGGKKLSRFEEISSLRLSGRLSSTGCDGHPIRLPRSSVSRRPVTVPSRSDSDPIRLRHSRDPAPSLNIIRSRSPKGSLESRGNAPHPLNPAPVFRNNGLSRRRLPMTTQAS